jgi:hypothetical protein
LKLLDASRSVCRNQLLSQRLHVLQECKETSAMAYAFKTDWKLFLLCLLGLSLRQPGARFIGKHYWCPTMLLLMSSEASAADNLSAALIPVSMSELYQPPAGL